MRLVSRTIHSLAAPCTRARVAQHVPEAAERKTPPGAQLHKALADAHAFKAMFDKVRGGGAPGWLALQAPSLETQVQVPGQGGAWACLYKSYDMMHAHVKRQCEMQFY